MSSIPAEATGLSVFAVKDEAESPTGKTAYIGYYLPNGNFHFVGVPYEAHLSKI